MKSVDDSETGKPGSRDGAGRFVSGRSGNPSGTSKARRNLREKVRASLDAAFTREDGSDELVEALVTGVRTGDATMTRLACEYRWGKPTEHVEITDGRDAEVLALRQLEALRKSDTHRAHVLAVAEALADAAAEEQKS